MTHRLGKSILGVSAATATFLIALGVSFIVTPAQISAQTGTRPQNMTRVPAGGMAFPVARFAYLTGPNYDDVVTCPVLMAGTASVNGWAAVNTGLTSVTAATVSLIGGTPSITTAHVVSTTSASAGTIYVQAQHATHSTNATLVQSSSTVFVSWFAAGQ